MNVLALLGSPKKNGNTASVLKSFLKGLKESCNVEIEQIFLHEKKIFPCTGCDSCQKYREPACVIKDDMIELYPLLQKSELIVMATPVYWWSVSAQLKLFIDRMYAMMKGEDNANLSGKKIVLLTTYGGEDPNTGPDIIKRMLEDICEFTGMKLIHTFGVCTGKLDAANNPDALERAYCLGKECIGC